MTSPPTKAVCSRCSSVAPTPPSQPRCLAADIEQIRRRFGWEPAVSIDEAIAELWRNPDLSEHLVAKYPIERAAPEPAFLVGAENFSESRASVA